MHSVFFCPEDGRQCTNPLKMWPTDHGWRLKGFFWPILKKKLWQKTSSSSPVWAMLLSLLLKTIYKTISPSVGTSVHSSDGCLVFVLLAFECATLQQLCNILSWIFSLKILFLLLADFFVATKEKDRLYKRQLIIVIPGISSGNIYHLDMKEKIRCSDCIWCRFVRLQNYLWDTKFFFMIPKDQN